MKRSTRLQALGIATLFCAIVLAYSASFSDVQLPPSVTTSASADFIHPASESMRTARELIQSNEFERAKTLLEQLTNDESALVRGQAQCSLAEVAIRTGVYVEAEELIPTCIASSTKVFSAELEAYGHHLSGYKMQLAGEYENAIEQFERALQLEVAATGADSSPFLNTLNNLANVHYRLGHLDLATQMHSEVLEGRMRLLDENHPKIAASLGNLGNVFEASGQSELAYGYHMQALTI